MRVEGNKYCDLYCTLNLISLTALACPLTRRPVLFPYPSLTSRVPALVFSVMSLPCIQWVNASQSPRTKCNRCYDCDSARDPCAWSKADYKVR